MYQPVEQYRAIMALLLRVCSTSLLKTLWENEKLLVTSNLSLSHSVFYLFGELSAVFIKLGIVVSKLVQFGRVQKLSFWKGLTKIFGLDQIEAFADEKFNVAKFRISVFDRVENTVGRAENAV